jgi:Glyoxalase superfamily protein
MNAQQPEMNMQLGQQVKGKYFNVAFTGVVSHMRPHTMNNHIVLHIELDAEIEVFGDKRAAIAMEVNAEGCAAGYPGRVLASDPITAYYSQAHGHGQPAAVAR